MSEMSFIERLQREEPVAKKAKPTPQMVRDAQTASVFYGIVISKHEFWYYLLKHDATFQADCVAVVRANDREFRNYTLDDVLADVIEEWRMDANFKRKNKPKSRNLQCADTVEDLSSERIARICGNEKTQEYMKKDIQTSPVRITRFPNMDIEFFYHDESSESGVYIGKRVFVYRDGKPCTDLPDMVAQIKTALAEDASKIDTPIGFV
jgi:hypothetical protein